ncbi:MAG: T9SS type A sorting domain-containing protein [Chitinophagaceae bacterium]|nr:T9SS type A sorting domain-containing protein [Chitinophagaceae bacterium]
MKLKNYALTAAILLYSLSSLNAQILFDNGPVFNSIGTGAGGANESVLLTTTFGMGTIGFGHQASAFNRIADDVVVTSNWQIDSLVFYAYQTGSTTTSTMTQVNFMIWNGVPGSVGATVVYGDSTTNRLSSSTFSNTYRITETTTGNATRPIMRNVCATPGLSLTPGTYWIDWQTAGSLASGPWAPSRVPAGQNITGNALQRVSYVWNNAVDGGTGTPAQGFPFEVYGVGSALPVELISFTGEVKMNTNVLEWSTANETNNEFFDIERSADGIYFETIGRKIGAGTTQELTTYSFVDMQPLQGINYYRLKQTDMDGKHTYSQVLSLQQDVATAIAVYPNPAKNDLFVTGLTETAQTYTILNHLGQALLSGIVSTQQSRISLETLAPGSYLIRIGKSDIRFVKQ